MIILGIDPGTGRLGFGAIDVQGAKSKFIDGGVITTEVNSQESSRLVTIYAELSGLISSIKPDCIVVEKLFFAQNVTTAIHVAQARGVVMLCARQNVDEIYEYTPLQVKMGLTGYGRASKQQIQEMVRVLLGLKSVPKPDDAADALALALVHSHQLRVK